MLILGSLDGIETGVRQLIRGAPLETMEIQIDKAKVVTPTPAEILRIKCALVLKRNATRDYVDVAALSDRMGLEAACEALLGFDALYPQPSGQSALQQLIAQLNSPAPYDLDTVDLSQYRNLAAPWTEWRAVVRQSATLGTALFDLIPKK